MGELAETFAGHQQSSIRSGEAAWSAKLNLSKVRHPAQSREFLPILGLFSWAERNKPAKAAARPRIGCGDNYRTEESNR